MAYPGSQTKIVITHDKETAADLQAQYITAVLSKEAQIGKLETLINQLGMGIRMGSIALTIDDGAAASATGTVTFSSLVANDTITIGGVVFTAKASGAAGQAQFNIGASDTTAAVAFAAAVLAHTSLTGLFLTAVPAAGVTTLTAQPGNAGNLIGLAISAHGSVSGALMTGGTASASSSSVTYKHGV
jgi:hypothetical protein